MRGATRGAFSISKPNRDFNPRSPCGERLERLPDGRPLWYISIHAPHAGSDAAGAVKIQKEGNFNPRSPCGERQKRRWKSLMQ